MPAETLTAEQLRSAFAAKGISAQELVALSGAHTVRPPVTAISLFSFNCFFLLSCRWHPRRVQRKSAGRPSPPYPMT